MNWRLIIRESPEFIREVCQLMTQCPNVPIRSPENPGCCRNIHIRINTLQKLAIMLT